MEPYALLLACMGCIAIGSVRTASWLLDRREQRLRSNYTAFVMVEEAKREVRRRQA